MNREYRTVLLANGKQELVVLYEDDKFQLLNTFFFIEIGAFSEWVKELFDKVLSGESKYEELTGNACTAEISPKTTKIFDALADDGMGHWCEVDTKELRMLIDEWHEKKAALKD